jgi:hypothetical protein
MITFKSDTCKKMKFNIGVTGVDPAALVSKFTLLSENISVSFPAKMIDNDIVVEIPALENAVGMFEGNISAKLEIIAGDTYITPWEDTVKIDQVVKVEARITEVEEIEKKLEIKASIIAELDKPEPKKAPIVKEEKKVTVKKVPEWLK